MTELNDIYLDRTSAVPLYEQLRRALLESITSGRLPAGTKLPTEEELCLRFGISRPVARQAYAALIDAGYVERMRGRGTFVRTTDLHGLFLHRQISFAAEMKLLGKSHRTVLCDARWVGQSEPLFRRLALGPDDRCYHLTRMRYVEEKPYVLVENDLPASKFPGIDQYDFARESLYDVLERVYHIRIVRSHRIISACPATPACAALFGLSPATPMLCVENLSFDDRDRPVDFSREFLDGAAQNLEFEVINK